MKRRHLTLDSTNIGIGLLQSATRLASGYQRYGETEVRRLRFVLRVKSPVSVVANALRLRRI